MRHKTGFILFEYQNLVEKGIHRVSQRQRAICNYILNTLVLIVVTYFG